MKTYHSAAITLAMLALFPSAGLAQEVPADDGSIPADEQEATVQSTQIIVDATREEEELVEEEDPGDRMVCKRERRTGSRISRKKCLTQTQWDLLDEESRQLLENIGDNAASGGFTGLPDPVDFPAPGG